MPTRRRGGSHFISPCVRMVMGERKEQKAAFDECYGIWRQHRSGTSKLFLDVIRSFGCC